MDPIASVGRIAPAIATNGASATAGVASAGNDFGQLFDTALDRLNQTEATANNAITKLAAGEDIELHQVMMAVQEADVSFQIASQMRNKLVEAYQEIMRMQV